MFQPTVCMPAAKVVPEVPEDPTFHLKACEIFEIGYIGKKVLDRSTRLILSSMKAHASKYMKRPSHTS